jgi:polyferredoxin
VFVVGGLPLIVIGNARGWAFVNGWWFRLAHLAAIAVVVAQAWLGVVCPLTTLESWLRAQAGQAGYDESFIEHWLTRVLFYDAPWWMFAAAYTLFGLGVAAAWWRYPPRRRGARAAPQSGAARWL